MGGSCKVLNIVTAGSCMELNIVTAGSCVLLTIVMACSCMVLNISTVLGKSFPLRIALGTKQMENKTVWLLKRI